MFHFTDISENAFYVNLASSCYWLSQVKTPGWLLKTLQTALKEVNLYWPQVNEGPI